MPAGDKQGHSLLCGLVLYAACAGMDQGWTSEKYGAAVRVDPTAGFTRTGYETLTRPMEPMMLSPRDLREKLAVELERMRALLGITCVLTVGVFAAAVL